MPLSPSQLADLEALVAEYATTMAALETSAAAAAWSGYEQVEDWYDTAQTTAAVLFAVQVASQLRLQTGGATSQFVAQSIALLADSAAAGLGQMVLADRGGVTPFNVWFRPVREYRDTIAVGENETTALQRARERAEVMAMADSMLVRRSVAIAEYQRLGITGYRRVIRPELSRTGSCGLCIAASDQIYATSKLMPLHDRCNCIALPIVGDLDPGLRINDDDLARLYDDAGGNSRFELKRTRYRVEEHGELGPILVNAAHASSSSDTSEQAMAARADALLARMLPILREMQANPSAFPDAWRAYQADRVNQLRRFSDAA